MPGRNVLSDIQSQWEWPAVVGALIALAFCVGFVCAFLKFEARARKLAKQLGRGHRDPLFVEPPWAAILATSTLLGVGVFCVWLWAAVSIDASTLQSASADLFVKGVVPLMALAYFSYQIFGGALFATTSVTLTAERSKVDPGLLLVKFSIERGAQWVAEIASDAIALHATEDLWLDQEAKWLFNRMPRRRDRILRMAAGEKSSTEIGVEVPLSDFYVTARVVSHAIYWPAPSESFARIYVPAYKPPVGRRPTS